MPEALQEIQEVWAKLELELHPSKTGNILGGVRDRLNNMLMRYSEDFGGVVLSYSNEKLTSTKGAILESLPYVHVQATAVLLLFSPTVGQTLEGVVNQVCGDHLGLLVMGVFNASIAVTDTEDSFDFDESEQSWSGKVDYRHKISVGTNVKFRLKGMQEASRTMGTIGTLIGALGHAGTGNVQHIVKDSESKKRLKKEKASKKNSEKDKSSKKEFKKLKKESKKESIKERGEKRVRDQADMPNGTLDTEVVKKKRKKMEKDK